MWHWWKGSVHHGDGILINHLCGERDKGSGRAPLVNPRGPARKSVLRTTLTSRVPDYGRLDSTSCLGSPLSAIHGVQTLSFTLRFADFSGDTTPRCHIADQSHTGVAVGAVFVGRIRRSRHPAIDVAETLPDGAYRLSGLRRFSDFFYVCRIRRSRHPAINAGGCDTGCRGFVGRIRRSRHPAIGAAEKMPDGASLIRPTRFQRLFVLHYSVYALFSPISAV